MMIKSKKSALILFMIFAAVSAYAEKKAEVTADPFPSERPGQYVYYHDMRTGIYGNKEPVNRLVGFMKADNKQYIVSIFNLKDRKSFLFLGHFYLNKGIMEFATDSMQGDPKEGTFLMADLMNLMNYLGSETVKVLPKLSNKNDIAVNSDWESYKRKFVNSYRWWIPFYKLESCRNALKDSFGEKDYTSFKLVCFGTVPENDPDIFTRINRLPVYYKEKTENTKYLIPPAVKMAVKLDNTSIMLDKNWHFEKANPASGLYHDSYWLKKFTVRDAQIGVESIPLTNIKLEKNEINTFVSTLQFQSCVIADTVKIDLKGKTLILTLWDADNGTATFTEYLSLGIKNNVLIVLNFSAFDFIYYANTDYFKPILNSDFNN